MSQMLEELKCILSFLSVYKFTLQVQKIFWETMQAIHLFLFLGRLRICHTQYHESLTFVASSERKRILPKQNCVYF